MFTSDFELMYTGFLLDANVYGEGLILVSDYSN